MKPDALYGPDSPFLRLPSFKAGPLFARQLVLYAGLGAIVALAGSRLHSGGLPPIRLRFSWVELGWGCAGVAAFVVYNGLSTLLLGGLEAGRALLSWLRRRGSTMFGALSLRTLLALALLAGVCEEVIFRGWLQPVAGLGVTSVLFTLAHFPPTRYRWAHPMTWAMMAVYLPVSVGVGWLYLWRGNLLAPIVTHVVSDGLGLVAMTRATAAR